MTDAIFVAGTDTEVGKTAMSLGIMRAWQAAGHSVVGMKPVASGSERCAEGLEGLINEDARLLQEQSSIALPYEQVNPYAFAPPIAPHLAAAEVGERIHLERIVDQYQQLRPMADRTVVEGVGGWMVPLNESQTTADLVVQLQLPVVLVVAIRLGCINHALLTAAAIEQAGVPLIAWIANRLNPESMMQDEIVATLCDRLPAPLWADVPYQAAATSLNMSFRMELVLS